MRSETRLADEEGTVAQTSNTNADFGIECRRASLKRLRGCSGSSSSSWQLELVQVDLTCVRRMFLGEPVLEIVPAQLDNTVEQEF